MTPVMDPNKKFRKELNSGTFSLILLSILKKTQEPLYGYQITKMISEESNNLMIIKQGALYPVLRSLANAGLLESFVNPSVSGPPRRYYSITDEGRKTHQEWSIIWQNTAEYIGKILGGKDD